MLAILLMDLLLEFSTEVTLIKWEHAMLFDEAVEILRSREQRVSLSLGAGSSSSSSSTNNSSNGSINSAHGEKKRDLFCEYHGKCGHATDQCHKLNGSHPRGGSGRAGRGRGRGQGQTNQRGGRNGNAHSTSDDLPRLMVDDDTCTAPRDEIALNTTKLKGAAIFDSRCSCHVCSYHFCKKLIGWHTGPTVSIWVANGKQHTSDQYASLLLTISTDEGPREVIFSEVLYIEEITNLLLLVGVMTQQGATFTFTKDSMTMEHPSMTITVQKSTDENLYRLQFLNSSDGPNLGHETQLPKKEVNISLAISKEILNQHYTLGHLGQGVMIQLSKSS